MPCGWSRGRSAGSLGRRREGRRRDRAVHPPGHAYTDVLNPRDDEGFTLPKYIVHDDCWWNFLMSTAMLMDYHAVGQLLRTFDCPIRGDPHESREMQEEEIRAIKEWLGPPHPNQSFLRRPQPHSRSAQHDGNNADRNLPSVATKWPSEARSPVPRRISHPSGPLTDSRQQWIDLGRLVEQYDSRVRLLRAPRRASRSGITGRRCARTSSRASSRFTGRSAPR